jgi:hypothetical protein
MLPWLFTRLHQHAARSFELHALAAPCYQQELAEVSRYGNMAMRALSYAVRNFALNSSLSLFEIGLERSEREINWLSVK